MNTFIKMLLFLTGYFFLIQFVFDFETLVIVMLAQILYYLIDLKE